MPNVMKIGHRVAEAHFPPIGDSTILCDCKDLSEGPTPELADLEWIAHRKKVGAGVGRPNLRNDDGARFM